MRRPRSEPAEVLHMRAILILLLTTRIVIADSKPGDNGTPEHQKAASLVKQLGDKRFATRETAAKQLVEMGAAAVPALTAGTKSDDEEVRNHSIALLPQARATERNRQAEAYVADKAGKLKHDLPLLAEWEKLIGKPDAGSRKLFAEMVRTNGELLEQAVTNPEKANEAVKARCRTIRIQIAAGGKQVSAEMGELAALFFIHSRVSKDQANWATTEHPAHLLNNPGLAAAISAKDIGPAFRRTLLSWVDSSAVENDVGLQFFTLAVWKTPFPEAVPMLARMAKEKISFSGNARAIAIETLGKIGDADAKSALEAIITETTPVLGGFGGHGDLSVGDCAFAALVTAYGKKPADYGETGVLEVGFRTGDQELIELHLRSFPNGQAREKGLKKWKDEARKK